MVEYAFTFVCSPVQGDFLCRSQLFFALFYDLVTAIQYCIRCSLTPLHSRRFVLAPESLGLDGFTQSYPISRFRTSRESRWNAPDPVAPPPPRYLRLINKSRLPHPLHVPLNKTWYPTGMLCFFYFRCVSFSVAVPPPCPFFASSPAQKFLK